MIQENLNSEARFGEGKPCLTWNDNMIDKFKSGLRTYPKTDPNRFQLISELVGNGVTYLDCLLKSEERGFKTLSNAAPKPTKVHRNMFKWTQTKFEKLNQAIQLYPSGCQDRMNLFAAHVGEGATAANCLHGMKLLAGRRIDVVERPKTERRTKENALNSYKTLKSTKVFKPQRPVWNAELLDEQLISKLIEAEGEWEDLDNYFGESVSAEMCRDRFLAIKREHQVKLWNKDETRSLKQLVKENSTSECIAVHLDKTVFGVRCRYIDLLTAERKKREDEAQSSVVHKVYVSKTEFQRNKVWTEAMDDKLEEALKLFGGRWEQVAKFVDNDQLTAAQCIQRVRFKIYILKEWSVGKLKISAKDINKSVLDEALAIAVLDTDDCTKLSTNWDAVSDATGLSKLGCRNRWAELTREGSEWLEHPAIEAYFDRKWQSKLIKLRGPCEFLCDSSGSHQNRKEAGAGADESGSGIFSSAMDVGTEGGTAVADRVRGEISKTHPLPADNTLSDNMAKYPTKYGSYDRSYFVQSGQEISLKRSRAAAGFSDDLYWKEDRRTREMYECTQYIRKPSRATGNNSNNNNSSNGNSVGSNVNGEDGVMMRSISHSLFPTSFQTLNSSYRVDSMHRIQSLQTHRLLANLTFATPQISTHNSNSNSNINDCSRRSDDSDLESVESEGDDDNDEQQQQNNKLSNEELSNYADVDWPLAIQENPSDQFAVVSGSSSNNATEELTIAPPTDHSEIKCVEPSAPQQHEASGGANRAGEREEEAEEEDMQEGENFVSEFVTYL